MARKLAQAVSDYEAQRQEKIARNQSLLKELQLNAASAGLTAKASSNKQRPSSSALPKRKPAPKIKQEDFGPRRTSSRLKGIVADSEVAKRKAEEETEAIIMADRVKRQRVSEDIKLGDAVVAGRHWNQTGNWLSNVGPADPYQRTFDDEEAIKTTSDKELRELREQMNKLQLWEGFEPNRIKITPERIYSMAFAPTTEKALVFAGDKLGNLGLFDASQAYNTIKNEDDDGSGDELDDINTPAITTFKLHTRTISNIHFTPTQPQSLFTSSYDSSIRRLDLEKGIATEVYAPASRDDDEPLSGLSIPQTDPSMLYFTTLNGTFGMHDTRTSSSSPPTVLLQLSDKKIGGFSVHPMQSHLLATASLDRTLKLWDLRKISGRANDRMPALLAEHESKLSVSHAAFNAAGQIATTSYDDTIKIHTLPGTGSIIAEGQAVDDDDFAPVVIPHNNQTGRWVTILRPHWQAQPESGAQKFCIGNMNRFIDVYTGTGEQLAQLGDSNITAVPAVACFHERRNWIAGGTASGKLALWM